MESYIVKNFNFSLIPWNITKFIIGDFGMLCNRITAERFTPKQLKVGVGSNLHLDANNLSHVSYSCSAHNDTSLPQTFVIGNELSTQNELNYPNTSSFLKY